MRWTAVFFVLWSVAAAADLRIGIIGTDTSHAAAFTKILNNATNPEHVPGAKVVAAFKGGSPDVKESSTRVDKFADQLKNELGIEMVADIPTLLSKVDAVLLLSVDGRKHLEQAKPVFAAHKPVFIDKPLASTLEDARAIAKLGRDTGTPWFSSSSLRFGEIGNTMRFDDAQGAITWGPGPFEEHHYLDLSWYAIHPVELLFTLLGPGCEEVTRISGTDADEVTCKWKNGRVGTVRALRPYGTYGAVVFRPKTAVQSPANAKAGYAPLIVEIVKFFQTGKPPVSNDETLEIFAFLDAAQRSKEAGGKPVKLR
jgi:hypothetical protein